MVYELSYSAKLGVVSISITQMYITSTPFILCIKANHNITVDGIKSVYMHAHLYHTCTYYQALRKIRI